jgi:hypothetical protein
VHAVAEHEHDNKEVAKLKLPREAKKIINKLSNKMLNFAGLSPTPSSKSS